jgi:radical SAM superfamily enzyme YgiQ (UPF0313 family)
MKIVLVNPMYYMFNEYPPIGLAYLGAALEEGGFDVSILDMKPGGIGYEELGDRLRGCDVVGVTSMSENSRESVRAARIAKKLGKTVVVGGPHMSMLPARTMSHDCMDFGVVGEGERTIVELMEYLAGSGSGRGLKDIRGLVFREGGCLTVNAPRELIEDLDRLPPPAYHLLPPMTSYFAPQLKNFPLGAVMSSRGCPFGCVYCSKSVFGRTFRQHSPERVVTDIMTLVRDHGVREIHVLDDAFNTDKERAKNIFRSLIAGKVKCSIYFPAGLRIDKIDGEFISLLKDAGGYGLNVGVETGNSRVMKSINKSLSLETVAKNAKMIMDNGLLLSANFMVGHLADTEETMNETVDFAIKLNPNFAGFQLTTIYRDTELYRQAAALGLADPENETGFEYCIPPGFDLAKLKKLRRRAMTRFMLRAAYLPRLFVLRFLSTWESR